ncbi:hypothetical protein RFN58_04805 [Streptomyces iakyrus]|uniref:hypothetical protein n=1 Tax=Streptomyces iakyrus TaxID=68219 RepID=UPI0012FF2DA4|nr:hypothetical protein [Streptomyces iakyrus]
MTAKPWNERRIERLLQLARDPQIVQLACMEAKYRTAPHELGAVWDVNYELGAVWDVNSLLRELDEDLAKYSNQRAFLGDWASEPVRALLSIRLGTMRAMVAASVVAVDYARETMGEGAATEISRDSAKAVLQLAKGFLEIPLEYALTPKWKVRKRAVLSRRAKRIVRDRDSFVRKTISRNQAVILAARHSGQGG